MIIGGRLGGMPEVRAVRTQGSCLFEVLPEARVTAADWDEICVRQRGRTEAYREVRLRERRGRRTEISPKMRVVTDA